MEKALRKSQSIFARYYLNDAFNDIYFDFELRDDIKIGQDFTVVSKHFLFIIFCFYLFNLKKYMLISIYLHSLEL